MTDRQYVYKITEVVKVVDGDSFWVRCDVGFRQNILINVRLLGYDCPEAHKGSSFEKSNAVHARDEAAYFLSAAELWIHTEKDPDNFGRWLGDIWCLVGPVETHLGEYLRERKLASIWPTRWRDEYEHLDAIPVETP